MTFSSTNTHNTDDTGSGAYSGFVRISRNIVRSPYFEDDKLLRAWIALHVNMRFKPTVVDKISLEPGDALFTKDEISWIFGVDKRGVRSILNRMQRDGYIRWINIGNRYTLVSVIDPMMTTLTEASQQEECTDINQFRNEVRISRENIGKNEPERTENVPEKTDNEYNKSEEKSFVEDEGIEPCFNVKNEEIKKNNSSQRERSSYKSDFQGNTDAVRASYLRAEQEFESEEDDERYKGICAADYEPTPSTPPIRMPEKYRNTELYEMFMENGGRKREDSVTGEGCKPAYNKYRDPDYIYSDRDKYKKNEKKTDENKNTDEKKAYGIFGNVYLTDDEYQKVKDEIGTCYEYYINKVSVYIEAHPDKTYASHCATVISWYMKEASEGKIPKTAKKSPDPTASYDIAEAERRARSTVPTETKRRR